MGKLIVEPSQNAIPLTPIGGYFFHRHYLADTLPAGVPDQTTHCVENHTGSIAWAWALQNGTYTFSLPRWTDGSSDGGYRNSRWQMPGSTKNRTVWLELRLARDTYSTAQIALRAYDYSAGGILIGDNDSFLNGNGLTLTQGIQQWGVCVTGNATDQLVAECFQSVDCGQPNQSGSNWLPGLTCHFSDFAMRTSSSPNDWIGPYPQPFEV